MQPSSLPEAARAENSATLTENLPDDLRLSAYHYELPRELVASYPLPERDGARMLLVNRQNETLSHHSFADLSAFLSPGDVVVVNNTQVLPARLIGHRQGHTGKVEILLLHPDPNNPKQWSALMKPTRKLPPGTRVEFPGTTSTVEILYQEEQVRGQVLFHLNDHESVESLMEAIGNMPIPPYLARPAEASDKERYQTVFSKVPGAHAAPTAGLHFTPSTLQHLQQKGIEVVEVTLAVSTGTFRSVTHEDVRLHTMDPEHYTLEAHAVETILAAKASGNKILAVGTTVAKTLETVAQKFNGTLAADSDWSRLFIYPGFEFKVVDALLTNFHLPQTTLLMLISAFANRPLILSAYQEAVARQYRFFSYGDCMLIL